MRKPPYARLLIERREKTGNSWWVLIGSDAWQVARVWEQPGNNHRPFTICPPNSDPVGYDWHAYRDAPPPVGLVRCGEIAGGQLRGLVDCLLKVGSPRVFDMFADTVFRRTA